MTIRPSKQNKHPKGRQGHQSNKQGVSDHVCKYIGVSIVACGLNQAVNPFCFMLGGDKGEGMFFHLALHGPGWKAPHMLLSRSLVHVFFTLDNKWNAYTHEPTISSMPGASTEAIADTFVGSVPV